MWKIEGGEVDRYFTFHFFAWWWKMPQVILEFPYVGMDYMGDPKMVVPLGE
jgi:hypothetical protein